jgi:hypothetical protein
LYGYARRQENAPSFIDISLLCHKRPPDGVVQQNPQLCENDMYKRKLRESRELHRSIIQSIRETLFEKSFESMNIRNVLAQSLCRSRKNWAFHPKKKMP